MKTMDDFEKIRAIFYEYEKGRDGYGQLDATGRRAGNRQSELYIMFYPEFKKDEVFQKIKDAGFPEVTESPVR